MKKLKLISSLVLTLTILSGCTQTTNIQVENQEITSEVIHLTLWGGSDDQQLLAGMVESFKDKYREEATFEVTIAATEEGEAKNKILSDINQAPDVFSFVDDQLMELAAAGVIEAVEEESQIKAENVEGAIEAASINEKIYAYPMTADNGYFMFYNKKYLSEQDVTTLDKILSVASSLNKKVTMDWTSGWYLYAFFGNTGLEMGLNSDGLTNYCDWNSKSNEIKGVDVGNAMLAIAQNPGFMNGGDDQLMTGAKDGSVIAGVSGVWMANALQQAWGDDFAAVKLPTYTVADKQVQLSSYAGYKMVGVNAYSKEKEWAIKLAQWLTSEENQTLRFINRGLGPSNTIASAKEEVKKSPAIQALIEQSQHASLQRVGAKYWEAASEFGGSLTEGIASAHNMQQLMDAMVKQITMKVTD